MDIVQLTPVEIRNLDLNMFRLALKDLEDDVEGIPFLDTHRHNTEVALGGLVYARVIEIINGYTVTFEDGQYAVNLIGANSNVGDVVNVNQVSIRSTNAAGLISNSAIEYASFDGGVTIDVINGAAGTVYNTGTPERPSNNLPDALLIAEYRGLPKLLIRGDITIPDGIDISDYEIVGQSQVKTTVTLTAGAITDGVEVNNATVTGVLDGDTLLEGCIVQDIEYFNGYIKDCGLKGTIFLSGGKNAILPNCYTIDQDDPPIIDMGDTGQSLAMPNYSGLLTVRNLSDPTSEVGVGVNAGQIVLEPTITAGTIIISGVGLLIDQTTGTAVVNTDGLMSKQTVSQAVWDEPLSSHLLAGSTGLVQSISQFGGVVHISATGTAGTDFPIGTERIPVNNMDDAVVIAASRGIDTFRFVGNFTITSGSYTAYIFKGRGRKSPCLTFDGTTLNGCQFREIEITGTVISGSSMGANFCTFGEFSGARIHAYECVFEGDIGLGPGESNFYTCVDGVPGIGIPNIQVGPCNSLGIWNWNGGIRLSNITTVDTVITCMIAQGRLWVDETCVEGDIIVKGMADLRGETGGTTIDQSGLIDKSTISEAVWDEPIADHLLADTTGHQMYHQAYDNVVHIDVINGASGTSFPIGTTHQPCNNLSDALTIADTHFMSTIHVVGSLTIDGEDITGKIIAADSSVGNSVTITSMINTDTTYFKDITVNGALSGSTRFTTCVLGALTGFDGGAKDCLLTGNVTITGAGANYFTNCDTYVTGYVPKQINVGNHYLNLIRCRGAWEIANYTGTSVISADFSSASLSIADSCVSGMIVVGGNTSLTDNSGPGCIVMDGTVTARGTAEKVWEQEPALRLLGLVQENQYLDQTVYTTYNNQKLLTSGRIRTYSDSASVGTSSNVVATYNITAVWSGDEMESYKVTKV